ncbi:MAG: ABC transporter substrate-binding protein [Candidatus Aminicenantes bacterium]|nr:ABC transporter substrate-binding protein [Candidatus Aminicenantes bacterium]
MKGSQRKIGFITLVLLLLLPRIPVSAQDKVFEDALGHITKMDSSPKRIISLAPNITEILFALGLGESVIGVTRFCDYPPEATQKEKIGGLVDPNLEKIISLNPDLIIGFRGNPIRLIKRMQEFNLPVFVLETGTTIDSVFSVIESVGQITWMEKRAAELLQPLMLQYQNIISALERIDNIPKVFVFLHGMGLWTCGKNSFMDDLLNKAKGKNIAGNIQKKWLLFSQEKLIAENPDFIIILSKSQEAFLEAKKSISKGVYLKTLQAVERGKVYFLDENLATRPGPRIIEALNNLARIFHPEAFSIK